ncbi:MAG: hypothetical protein IT337_17605 [Thermomicrobiales bacterium]|nr:hypothetical protein [Thermomicrobiales bacterium]
MNGYSEPVYEWDAWCTNCGNEFSYEAPKDHDRRSWCDTCQTWFGRDGVFATIGAYASTEPKRDALEAAE